MPTLHWIGKDKVVNHHQKVPFRVLEHIYSFDEQGIKTGEKNELKGVDLLSPDCKIRYIITVNALKEGWDCPFAYVLASLANRTSLVEVEQILGRVLRQPYARALGKPELNMCYVVTSSEDFSAIVKQVVKGLEAAGFSAEDYRDGGITAVHGVMASWRLASWRHGTVL